MKKKHVKPIFLLLLLSFSFYKGISQENIATVQTMNELKLNAAYLLLGFPELSYERILNEESAIGISAGFSIDDEIDANFLLIPYYRLYFGNKRAAGFFLEGNTGIFSQQVIEVEGIVEDVLGWGIGLGFGGKLITKSGWIGELVLGLGRNFVNEDRIDDVYPRLGISIGKRF